MFRPCTLLIIIICYDGKDTRKCLIGEFPNRIKGTGAELKEAFLLFAFEKYL